MLGRPIDEVMRDVLPAARRAAAWRSRPVRAYVVADGRGPEERDNSPKTVVLVALDDVDAHEDDRDDRAVVLIGAAGEGQPRAREAIAKPLIRAHHLVGLTSRRLVCPQNVVEHGAIVVARPARSVARRTCVLGRCCGSPAVAACVRSAA